MKIAALLLVIFFVPIALCLSAPDRAARTGTVSLPEAWQRVATSAGLAIGSEGNVVFVTPPERAAQLSLRHPRTFNCPAR